MSIIVIASSDVFEPTTRSNINSNFAQCVLKDGTVAFTGNQSMGNNRITNLLDPSSAQDAATKHYVENPLANVLLPNNIFYQAKDSGGTARNLLGLDTADNLIEYTNIDGTMREGAHRETYRVNVGALGASAVAGANFNITLSAQQTFTFRRAFTGTGTYRISLGVLSTEGNPMEIHGRVLNTGSMTFYVGNLYTVAGQTNCTGDVTVVGY